MTSTDIIVGLLSVLWVAVLGLVGVIWRKHNDEIKELKNKMDGLAKSHDALKLQVATDYLRKEDFKYEFEKLDKKLDTIMDKIDDLVARKR